MDVTDLTYTDVHASDYDSAFFVTRIFQETIRIYNIEGMHSAVLHMRNTGIFYMLLIECTVEPL